MKRKIAGALIIILSLGLLGFWELYGKEHIAYYRILTFDEDISANTQVSAEMISVKRVEYATKDALREENINEIIGLETSQFVAGGTELHREYFEEPKLVTGDLKDSFVLTIPESWILEYPQTVKRGDYIYFYLSGEFITKAVCYHARDSSNQEVTFSGESRLNGSSEINLIEVLVTREQASLIGEMASGGNKFTLLYTKGGKNDR